MKAISILLLFLSCLAPVGAFANHSVPVRGHATKRGTYVAPSHRTSPDHTQRNNWNTRGNVNPYTGKKGTRTAKH